MATQLSKVETQVPDLVQETLNLRRKELVEAMKTGIQALFNLMEQNDSDEQKKSTDFAKNMCLSELYRSVAYWESHLYDVSTNLQKTLNQNQNPLPDGNTNQTPS